MKWILFPLSVTRECCTPFRPFRPPPPLYLFPSAVDRTLSFSLWSVKWLTFNPVARQVLLISPLDLLSCVMWLTECARLVGFDVMFWNIGCGEKSCSLMSSYRKSWLVNTKIASFFFFYFHLWKSDFEIGMYRRLLIHWLIICLSLWVSWGLTAPFFCFRDVFVCLLSFFFVSVCLLVMMS